MNYFEKTPKTTKSKQQQRTKRKKILFQNKIGRFVKRLRSFSNIITILVLLENKTKNTCLVLSLYVTIRDRDLFWLLNMSSSAYSSSACSLFPPYQTTLLHSLPFSTHLIFILSGTLVSTAHFTQFSACCNVLGGASPLFYTLPGWY